MRTENVMEGIENSLSFQPSSNYKMSKLDNLAAKPRGMTGKVKQQVTNNFTSTSV